MLARQARVQARKPAGRMQKRAVRQREAVARTGKVTSAGGTAALFHTADANRSR